MDNRKKEECAYEGWECTYEHCEVNKSLLKHYKRQIAEAKYMLKLLENDMRENVIPNMYEKGSGKFPTEDFDSGFSV